jgi:hypothetical protein
VINDDSLYPGAACYRSLTEEGLPEVHVAVRDAKQVGWNWTMAASHDLLETLVNPSLNLSIFDSADGQKGNLYLREICDPVSSPRLAYDIDGVTVSNFVYPAWFEAFRKPGSTQFDHCGHVKAPFEVNRDSYVNFCEVTESSGWRSSGWHPETEPEDAAKSKPKSKRKTRR